MSSHNAAVEYAVPGQPEVRLAVLPGGAGEQPEAAPTFAALDDAVRSSGLDEDEAVQAFELGQIVAAHIAASGTVTLTDPDGRSAPLTLPAV